MAIVGRRGFMDQTREVIGGVARFVSLRIVIWDKVKLAPVPEISLNLARSILFGGRETYGCCPWKTCPAAGAML